MQNIGYPVNIADYRPVYRVCHGVPRCLIAPAP